MTGSRLHLLIVEDQEDIAANIADHFEGKGHIVDFAFNGEHGLELALEQAYDLIVLDLMLPLMDGLTVCQEIRKKANRHIPILMLTARDSLADKVTGFEKGADDYLTKPFALEELEVRCLALSKRHLLQVEHKLTLGPLILDRRQKTLAREGRQITLSHVGYKIIEALAEAHPQAVTRSELIQKIWGDEPTESDALRSHIYQLRSALDKPFEHAMIKTVHGVGFCLEVSDDQG